MGITWLGPLAMVLTAVVALGCVLTTRPRRWGSVVAATGMVVAMADMALGHVLLTPVAWAIALVALGVFVVALPSSGDEHAAWHHGLALVAAAVIMVVAPHALPTAGAAGHAGHPGPPGLTGGWIWGLAISVAYAVAALLPLGRLPARSTNRRPRQDRHLLQVITTTGCLVLMAVVPSLA
jgi:hypothetical protein